MTRSARPTARTWDDQPAGRGTPAGSLPIRVAEAALRHPVTTGGIFLSVVMIGVIAGNALGNQPKRHPHPWFQTRLVDGPATTGSNAIPLPQPAPLAPAAQPAQGMPAAAAPVQTPPAVLPRPRPMTAVEQPGALRDLQMALRDHGLYAGPIDGVLGPATAEAIRAFERRLGAPQTGEPSDLLLAAARALHPGDPATTASTPPPGRRVEAAPQPQPGSGLPVEPVAYAYDTPSMRIATADAVAHPVSPEAYGTLPTVEAEIEAPVFTGSIRRAAREPLAPGGEARLQKIQRNLIAAGYGPLKADGRWDDRSASAARRFEADNGWPVTGRPSERLVSGLALAVAGHRR